MTMWWTLWLICGLGSLAAFGICWLMRSYAQSYHQGQEMLLAEVNSLRGLVETLAGQHERRDRALRDHVQALQGSLELVLEALDKDKAEQAKLWLGSFLPDDASAARVESTLKMAEDRAISATGPIRYSSQVSKTSGAGSKREPLIRGVSSTGKK